MLVCEASQAGLAERGKVSRNPLKSLRWGFSATSDLPKQRREWSSNLKAFLIVRSFGAFGDGRKRKSFLKPIIEVFCILSFRAWQHKNRDEKSLLFAFHKVCSNQLLKFLLPFVQAPFVQMLKHLHKVSDNWSFFCLLPRLGAACKRLRIWKSLSGALRAPPLPSGEAKKERTNQLLKFLLPTFLLKEK